MSQKVALITGVNGQDGAYLAAFLLKKGYIVHGTIRRSSQINTRRIDSLYKDPHDPKSKFFLHYADLSDSSSMLRIVLTTKPDEVYNLGAQSHVRVSFDSPEYTADVDALGNLRLLEAIKTAGLEKTTRFYQASSSELFGLIQEKPQTEKTPFYPRSPYATAKLFAHWNTINYREAYGIFASCGILFNHESPLRGETFLTRKVTRSVARMAVGLEDCLFVGNLDSYRDWGHAKEYVEGMWMMLQHHTPGEFVLATNKQISVRDFVLMTFRFAGVELVFEGQGENEVGKCRKTNKVLLRIDPRYYRPSEVDDLLGDPSLAEKTFGWKAKLSVEKICEEMFLADLYRAMIRAQKAPKNLPFLEDLLFKQDDLLAYLKTLPFLKSELAA